MARERQTQSSRKEVGVLFYAVVHSCPAHTFTLLVFRQEMGVAEVVYQKGGFAARHRAEYWGRGEIQRRSGW